MARSDEFGKFVAARYGSLVRLAFVLSGDQGQAEDLAQSALLKTYLAWGRIRAPEYAEAYAKRTLIRLAGRSRRRLWRAEVPAGELAETAAPWPVHRYSSFSSAAQVDGAIDARRALLALPAAQREVLVLRFMADLSETETAELLGISRGTVKSRTSRGLASLREAGLLAMKGSGHDG